MKTTKKDFLKTVISYINSNKMILYKDVDEINTYLLSEWKDQKCKKYTYISLYDTLKAKDLFETENDFLNWLHRNQTKLIQQGLLNYYYRGRMGRRLIEIVDGKTEDNWLGNTNKGKFGAIND